MGLSAGLKCVVLLSKDEIPIGSVAQTLGNCSNVFPFISRLQHV
jgi:hypothetical protein